MIVAAVLVPIACCVGTMAAMALHAPHSNHYAAVSPREAREMARASRDVYPDEVRADLAGHRAELAWAGLLRSMEFIGDREHPAIRLTIEHHYFDWVEDHGAQRELYLLSPRGEGTFRCTWPIDPSWDHEAMRREGPPGSLMVVYGTPERLDGAVVDLGQAAYVRSLPPFLVTTRALDYGRHARDGAAPWR